MPYHATYGTASFTSLQPQASLFLGISDPIDRPFADFPILQLCWAPHSVLLKFTTW